VSKLSSDVLWERGRFFFFRAPPFIAADSAPWVTISRNLAPCDKLIFKVITHSFLLRVQPHCIRASGMSRIVDPTGQAWGSGKRHASNVVCPSKKSAIVRGVNGLNGKALREADR
jgi:hypothetical protein